MTDSSFGHARSGAGPTAAVILARGGSKGVTGKNLRKVGGVSLVGRSVLAAKAASLVEQVYVSTDDAGIAADAASYGAVIIDRPAEISGDTATSEAGWLHALQIIRESYPDVGRLVLLQCTSPFTTGEDIDGCLNAMEAAQAACALSVVPDHSFLWRRDASGRGVGVNHDEAVQRPRRQDMEPTFRESGAIYCVRVEDFERVCRRFCGEVALYEVQHPPVEIDSEEDLQLCRLYAQADGLTEHLKRKFSALRALVMDFDGVLTDDLAHVDETGRESVTVSRRDGLGLERLRRQEKWQLLILSKEKNQVVSRRAEKLGIECLQGKDDKLTTIKAWLETAGLTWNEVLYVGNDLNDIEVLKHVGVSACPQDADPNVLSIVDWIIPVDGGKGAVRAIADELLRASGTGLQ